MTFTQVRTSVPIGEGEDDVFEAFIDNGDRRAGSLQFPGSIAINSTAAFLLNTETH